MAVDFLKTAAMVLILGALWRIATSYAAKRGNDRLAGAMSFVF